MKFNTRSTDLFEWHRWFAWYPVQLIREYNVGEIHTRWAWFEWVEKRWRGSWGGIYTEYREIRS
jgi:hypothetical protein